MTHKAKKLCSRNNWGHCGLGPLGTQGGLRLKMDLIPEGVERLSPGPQGPGRTGSSSLAVWLGLRNLASLSSLDLAFLSYSH